MKIIKLENGNVEYRTATDEIIWSIPAAPTELKPNEVADQVKIFQSDGRVEYIIASEVTETQVLPNAAVPFVGDVYDLAELLSDDFFFGCCPSGGSTADCVTFQNEIHVDASKAPIAGCVYASYADAVSYILSLASAPSYFNRWAVWIHGSMPENNPVLYPWIYPMGTDATSNIIAEGNWTNNGAVTHPDAYQMYNLLTGGVDPNANTSIVVNDCILADQEQTSGTGNIILYSTRMFDGDNNANLNSCTLQLLEGSQATVTLLSNVIMYGDSYLTVKGTSITSIQAYGGGSQIYLNNNVVISGDSYIYNAEIYGVNFAALANYNISAETRSGLDYTEINARQLASLRTVETLQYVQLIDCLIYNVDFDAIDPGATLEVVGCHRGLGTETIQASAGTLDAKGDFFDNSGTSLVSEDTVNAIKELAASGGNTASNGLNKFGVDIRMGGALIQATDVTTATHLLALNSGSFVPAVDDVAYIFDPSNHFGSGNPGFAIKAGNLSTQSMQMIASKFGARYTLDLLSVDGTIQQGLKIDTGRAILQSNDGADLVEVWADRTAGIRFDADGKTIHFSRGGMRESQITKQGVNYAPTEADHAIVATAAITITLPLTPTEGTVFEIYANNNVVTVNAQAPNLIVGMASYGLSGYDAIRVKYFDANNWLII